MTTESAALYPYTVNLQSKVEGVRNKDQDNVGSFKERQEADERDEEEIACKGERGREWWKKGERGDPLQDT